MAALFNMMVQLKLISHEHKDFIGNGGIRGINQIELLLF
jgi:hypothetical protein